MIAQLNWFFYLFHQCQWTKAKSWEIYSFKVSFTAACSRQECPPPASSSGPQWGTQRSSSECLLPRSKASSARRSRPRQSSSRLSVRCTPSLFCPGRLSLWRTQNVVPLRESKTTISESIWKEIWPTISSFISRSTSFSFSAFVPFTDPNSFFRLFSVFYCDIFITSTIKN